MRTTPLTEAQRLEEAKRLAALTRLPGERRDNVVPWPAPGSTPHEGRIDPPIATEALKHFTTAAAAEDVEGIAGAMSRAFRAVERGHVAGQITRPLRSRLVRALFLAEDRARKHFPAGLFDDRVRHACVAALGLLNRWAQPPGSNARVEATGGGAELVIRFVGNELDSLCAEAELRRILAAEAAGAASDHRATEGTAGRG
ncbi:hypothetical protein ASG52_12855 [Methylobacterium sp. Leaf456]|nr:hypothetical protein ASG52_12855 [Methylobacterium sp. Leaf456]